MKSNHMIGVTFETFGDDSRYRDHHRFDHTDATGGYTESCDG